MADSQMIWSDVYAMLALAADRTSTIRLGTGVAVPATRIAPVTAAALATINQLAPGRVFCGIGRGNAAMRIMGHPSMELAEFDRYLTDLGPLLRGEEIEYEWRGSIAPIHHQMPNSGFVSFDHEIPLYVSAFGPKALDLAARHGDGLITSVPPDPTNVAAVGQAASERRVAHGRSADRADFPIATLTTTCVLKPGEEMDSDRVKEQVGAFAIAALHYAYEQYSQFGREPGHHLHDIWNDYLAVVESVPEERRLRTHLGHNCWVIPGEERFVTRAVIERSCLVGTPSQLHDRNAELEDAGLDQVVLLPPLTHKAGVIVDAAQVFLI